MNPDEAADLAARTLAAIDALLRGMGDTVFTAADRERVASDLAGIKEGWLIRSTDRWFQLPWKARDNSRYVDGLRRTAALYNVAE